MEPDILDVLLHVGPRKMTACKVRLRQLSEQAGCDAVFTVRELGYNEVHEIQRMESGEQGDPTVAVVLAGVTAPDLRAPALLERFSAPTPAEALKKMLSAGEIEELARRIEQLSGYRRTVTELVDEVKKNSTATGAPG